MASVPEGGSKRAFPDYSKQTYLSVRGSVSTIVPYNAYNLNLVVLHSLKACNGNGGMLSLTDPLPAGK